MQTATWANSASLSDVADRTKGNNAHSIQPLRSWEFPKDHLCTDKYTNTGTMISEVTVISQLIESSIKEGQTAAQV